MRHGSPMDFLRWMFVGTVSGQNIKKLSPLLLPTMSHTPMNPAWAGWYQTCWVLAQRTLHPDTYKHPTELFMPFRLDSGINFKTISKGLARTTVYANRLNCYTGFCISAWTCTRLLYFKQYFQKLTCNSARLYCNWAVCLGLDTTC